jgi:hypothetical protein
LADVVFAVLLLTGERVKKPTLAGSKRCAAMSATTQHHVFVAGGRGNPFNGAEGTVTRSNDGQTRVSSDGVHDATQECRSVMWAESETVTCRVT